MAKEIQPCVRVENKDAQLLDTNILVYNQLNLYPNARSQESCENYRNNEGKENSVNHIYGDGEALNIRRNEVKESFRSEGADDPDTKDKIFSSTEDETEKKRKRKKKRKHLILSDGRVGAEGNVIPFKESDIIGDNAKRNKKSKQHFRNNIIKDENGVLEYDIIVGNGLTPKRQIRLNEGALENKSPVKRKKKKSLLKKTSSKVGFLHVDSLPPITENRLDKTETGGQTSQTEIPFPGEESTTQRADSTCSLVSSCKETSFQKPLRFCVWITRFPLLSFFIVSLGHILTIAITAGLVASGYDVFPVVFDELPLIVMNDARLKDLTWRAKDSYEGNVYRSVYGRSVPTWYRGRVKDIVEVTFEKPGGNVLTRESLRLIQIAEERLFNMKLYQADYCTLDYYDACIKPKSILRFFDGTYHHIDSVFSDANFANINDVIFKASYYNETKEELFLLLGKDSTILQTRSSTSITRIFFPMGWPLAYLSNGYYGSKSDLEAFLVNTFKPAIESIRDNLLVDHLDVFYLSKMLLEHDLIEQALTDLKLAIGSCLFIFLFMCFQTGSVTVTFLGILSILSSFLLTNLLYRLVFQFIYFGFFHVISIFLILGIGADDLFVFYDTWRLTGKTKYPSDAHRLSECYRRAAKTTFVTSCTTMMAFFVSGFSPLLPVQTFGIFSGVLVAINYIWVIVYFPTIIILHHAKVKGIWYKFHTVILKLCVSEYIINTSSKESSPRQSSCSSIQKRSENILDTNSAHLFLVTDTYIQEETTKSTLFENDLLTANTANCDKRNRIKDTQSLPQDNNDISAIKDSDKSLVTLGSPREQIPSDHSKEPFKSTSKPKKNFEDRNRVVLCFRNGFFDLISKRPVKILIMLVFLGITLFFIHRATLLEPDTHQLRLFRDNHNYAKASMKHYFSFLRNDEDEYTRLYIVWGLHPVDISNCDLKSAAYCRGTPVLDEKFDMNIPEAQVAFKELCNRLEYLDSKTAEDLRIRRDATTGQLQIACLVKPLETYFKRKTQSSQGIIKYGTGISLDLPLSTSNVTHFVEKNRLIFRNSLPSDFNYHFEILTSYWLTNAYTLSPTPDYFKYNELVGEKKVDGVTDHAYYYYSGLYYGTKLQYLAIEINTTMNVYSLGYKEGLPVYYKWEALVNDLKTWLPPSLQGVFQATTNLWHWLHVQEILATSSIIGILVGLSSAWIILILTTFNYVIGTLAVIIIGLVSACVIGIIPLAGWKLGVLESINLCMVVGLSVDYVVHLAEAYRMSPAERRHDRVKDMLQSMGLSVVSGAITTLGAATFMLFAQIQFFFQFGIFIISTVGMSLVFSLLGFTTIMALCGPQGDTGSLGKLAKKCLKCCFGDRCCKNSKIAGNNNVENARTHNRLCEKLTPCYIVEKLFDRISYGK